jgi:hypothetical protein
MKLIHVGPDNALITLAVGMLLGAVLGGLVALGDVFGPVLVAEGAGLGAFVALLFIVQDLRLVRR